MTRFSKVACLFALSLVFATGVFAQGGTADLTGEITDPTGALVPGAKITLTNDGTGVVRSAESSETGVYRFVGLPIVGTYTLRVEAAGFRTNEVGKIVLSVGQTVRQDVKLVLGEATSTVTVEAGTQMVQTTESQLSGLVDRRVWESMPLETRNQNTFINLLPGVTPDVFGGTTRGAAVNGLRPGTGNFLVEGFDNNDQGQGGRGALVAGGITSISPEAIQEYRVITNGYAAEYGKGGGFVNDLVLKSGTNEFHGGVFWYNRVQALAANDFFSNKAGIKDRLVRNQFGGYASGPVLRDRSFITGSYEGHLRRAAEPRTGTGFTQEFLNFVQSGQLATFHESDPNGLCMQISGNPCVGAFAAASSLGPIFQNTLLPSIGNIPFAASTSTDAAGRGPWTAGNNSFSCLPPSMANPFGTPCILGTNGLGLAANTPIAVPSITYPVPLYGQVTAQAGLQLNEHRVSLKSDNRITDMDQLNYTFLWEDSDTSSTLDGGDLTFGPAYASPGGSVLTGLNYQRTWSPTVLSTLKFSYLRHVRDFPNSPGLEGIPSIFTVFDPLAVGFGNSSSLPQFFTDNQFHLSGSVSVVKGKHTFKTGAEYRRTRNGSAFEAVRNGLFGFYAIEDLLTDGAFSDAADMAIYGAPYYGAFYYAQATIDPSTGTGSLPEFYRGYRANEYSGFFQDDWKVSSRLTFNLGVRYEYFGPPHNFRPGLDSNFYFASSATPVANPTGNVFFPVNSPWIAREISGRFEQRDSNIWNKDTNNWAPRFGFAYDLFGTQKWVIRGSYGIFYDRMWNNLFENIRFNAPFHAFSTRFFIPGNDGSYTVPFTSSANFAANPTPSPRHMDENLVTAYAQQWNLNVQHEFARNYVLDVAYVGTMGNKLLGVVDLNTFPGRTGAHDGGPSGRPNPTIAGDNFRGSMFRSNYHGLQIGVRKNFANGLQFQSNYTWSHSIDYVSDAFNNARGASLRPTDNTNWAIDRGNSDFDIRHRWTINYHYDLPWLKENKWLGGWTFSGFTVVQGGVPIPLFAGTLTADANQDGYSTDRPQFTGSSLSGIYDTGLSPADGFFNTSLFSNITTSQQCPSGLPNGGSIVAPTTFDAMGNVTSNGQWWCNSDLGRGVLTGPRYINFDFGVHKKFPITERLKLTFQANFFNLFNRTQFQVPSGNVNSGNFGKSLSTINGSGSGGTGARVTQLALRIDF